MLLSVLVPGHVRDRRGMVIASLLPRDVQKLKGGGAVSGRFRSAAELVEAEARVAELDMRWPYDAVGVHFAAPDGVDPHEQLRRHHRCRDASTAAILALGRRLDRPEETALVLGVTYSLLSGLQGERGLVAARAIPPLQTAREHGFTSRPGAVYLFAREAKSELFDTLVTMGLNVDAAGIGDVTSFEIPHGTTVH